MNIIDEAKLVAIKAHSNQSYSEVFPYEKHLQDVVDILIKFGFTQPEYLIAGWLHDSSEDTTLHYNDIRQHFGEEVAEIVFAVTDELGRNRKERKLKTFPKIRANNKAITIKLADRMANISHGLRMNSKQVQMYRKEYPEFRKALYETNPNFMGSNEGLWGALDKLVSEIPE